MPEAVKKQRPQFRNIHVSQIVRYRLPLGGMVSILHRISGALLFLSLPFLLYLLEKSLASEMSFDNFRGIASHWFVKLILIALAWGYLHHFCAGVRHLFMDVHIGITKDSSRKSAAGVLIVSLLLTVLVALKMFGAF